MFYLVKYSDYECSVAIISDDIVIVLPAIAQRPLKFLQLPLMDGLICRTTGRTENEVTIWYRQATGYQVSQGIKKATENIHLVFGDSAQSVAFAESINNRVAKRLADTSLGLQSKLASQRTSYASVDLTQSRETSIESEEETNLLVHVPKGRASIGSPSPADHRGAQQSHKQQERLSDNFPDLPQVRMSPDVQLSAKDDLPRARTDLQTTRKHQAGKGSTDQKLVMSSIRADRATSETTNDSQRRLKRPSAKSGGTLRKNDTDWEEDLRNDDFESEGRAPKKAKTTSTKAKTSNKAATGKNSQTRLKGGGNNKKTAKSKAKATSRNTATSTRTRRAATAKSSKYVGDSELDVEEEGGDQPGSVMEGSNPMISKQILPTKVELHMDDSQSQDSDNGLNSHELGTIKNVPNGDSSPGSPRAAQKRTSTRSEEVANDSYPMNTAAKSEALARNDISFGTKVAQTLAAKAQLAVFTIEQPSRRSFGDVKKFVEIVNVTRNSSPQKGWAKVPRNVQPEVPKATMTESSSDDRRPADSPAEDQLAQVQTAKAFDSPAHESRQVDGLDKAHKRKEIARITGEYMEQATSTSIKDGEVEDTESPNIPEDDQNEATGRRIPKILINFDTVAEEQGANQKAAATNITMEDTDKENQVQNPNIQHELPRTELPKPAVIALKWSPVGRKSRKVLQESLQEANAERSMDPPPRLPRRSERRGIRSSISTASGEENSSFIMTDESLQRKTPIVSFGAQGPRNQGVVSPSKKSKSGDASVTVSPEAAKHAAAKRQKKTVHSKPIALSHLAPRSDKVRGRSLAVVEDDEEILGQDKNVSESVTVGKSFNVDGQDEGILVEEESAVEPAPAVGAPSRGTTSQSSIVDENGSPRLHQSPRSLNSTTILQDALTIPEQSERSTSASEEHEQSVYTEHSGSSPAVVRSKQVSNRTAQPPKAKTIPIRASIGLQEMMAAKFPEAPKSMNTAMFRNQAKSILSKPLVLVEKTTVVEKAPNFLRPEKSVHPRAAQVGIDRAPPPSSAQELSSDPSTHVVRVVPKTFAEPSKPIEEVNPTPVSFNTGFKNLLMPPPPLPAPRRGRLNSKVAPVRQGKRKSSPRTEDEDLTLIDEEASVEHDTFRRPSTRHQRQQSPDSSTDSQSSPIPEYVRPKTEKGKETYEASSAGARITQQRLLNVLKRTTAVSLTLPFCARYCPNKPCPLKIHFKILAAPIRLLIFDRAYYSVCNQQNKPSRLRPKSTIPAAVPLSTG